MINVCVVTSTRAEYGLMRVLIQKLKDDADIDLHIAVTGTHLSHQYGMTYKEIEQDGFVIDKKIDILVDADRPSAISKTMALALFGFAEYFEELQPDLVIVDGDRYEMLAVCIAAMNENIPIVHIGGGEVTEGAIDDNIRHCITKMSYLHFVINKQYKKRVMQLGEDESRIYNVGSLGIENIKRLSLLTKKELEEELQFELGDRYALVTFHPVTLENNSAEKQITELLEACNELKEFHFLFTKANSDLGGRLINDKISLFVKKNEKRTKLVSSLGAKKYLSAVKYCTCVIGNSSSGLIEVPTFKVPTINIGDRQKGRIKAESILDCKPTKEDILSAVNMCQTEEFQNRLKDVKNPYDGGETSDNIVNNIKKHFLNKTVNLEKKFCDRIF